MKNPHGCCHVTAGGLLHRHNGGPRECVAQLYLLAWLLFAGGECVVGPILRNRRILEDIVALVPIGHRLTLLFFRLQHFYTRCSRPPAICNAVN